MLYLIIGKPGSGKSYFAVSKIAENLVDFARFEKRENKHHERVIYTNLQLNIDAINKYVSNQIGSDIDVSHYIKFLDSDFFFDKSSGSVSPRLWWEEIPNGALVVIDEVHEYVPSQGIGGKDYLQLFTVYISQHRHRGQDLYFITQHTDTIHKNILCMAVGAYHILNAKSRVLPWLGIPFSDIDVVKEAFGVHHQIANILYGNYIGRSFKKESVSTIVLRPEIYALYNSHQRGGVTEDSPSLKLSPISAIFWFVRRHIFHLSVKFGVVVVVFFILRSIFTDLPSMITQSMRGDTFLKKSEKIIEKVQESSVVSLESSRPSGNSGPPLSPPLKDSVIYVYCKNYIITDSGRVNLGETFIKDGKKQILSGVDIVYKSVICSPVPDGVQAVSGEGIAETGRNELQENSGG